MKILQIGLIAMLVVALVPVATAGPGEDKLLSISDAQERAAAAIEDMRTSRDKAEASLRQARSNGQMGRLDCVNEALIALKGVLKLAEGYLYDLQQDAKQSNKKAVKAVNDSWGKIKLTIKKVEDLDARLASCGGPQDEGVVEGKPIVERFADSDLPSQDPLEGLEYDPMVPERLQEVSPHQ